MDTSTGSLNDRSSSSRTSRWLDRIERVGNALPDPMTIFIGLGVVTLLGSWLAARAGLSAVNPVTGQTVVTVNLLTADGIRQMLTDVVKNFIGFAPLGVVLAAMIGIGVAERTGLIEATLTRLVTSVPKRLVTPALIFAGMLSHSAADAGIIILPPIAGILYARLGRHPLAGVATAFAGVTGGFSANVVISALDPMLGGLSQDAARLLDPTYTVHATANYYFMAASVLLLTFVGTWVSERIVEPRIGPWTPTEPTENLAAPDPNQDRGLFWAAWTLVAFTVLVVVLAWPAQAPPLGLLRSADGGLKPLYDSTITLVILGFLACGLAYGIATRKIRSDRDVSRMMSDTMSSMGTYIVLAFFASQALAMFRNSQLGLIIAVKIAATLKAMHLTGPMLFAAVILVTAALNLLVSSASAKWTMLAPVFVPMMMVLGYSPETTQALYRVGDSVTNIITPLNYYLPSIIVPLCRRYDARAGLGTVIALMVPYSLAFLIAWGALLIVWILLGWPVGPDAPLLYSLIGRGS